MEVLRILIGIYIAILFIRGILSWVHIPYGSRGILSQVNRYSITLTEPLLAPIRRIMPRANVGGTGIDFSLTLLILLLFLILSRL
jgi:YggT family protein